MDFGANDRLLTNFNSKSFNNKTYLPQNDDKKYKSIIEDEMNITPISVNEKNIASPLKAE